MANAIDTKMTYTMVDGKKYPNKYRGKGKKGLTTAPKGKYVTQTGKFRSIPKSKKK